MKYSFRLFILLISLWSCSFNKTKMDSADQLLNVSENSLDANYFRSHFEVAEIIPIQTNDTILISDIKKVIRYKNKIILLSGAQGHVFIIDATTGRFEGEINKRGRGPGESRKILDIAFYEELEQIIIFNDYSKLLFFDIEGEYLYEEEVGELFEEISLYDDEVVFYNKLDGYSCYPYVLRFFNIKEKKWRNKGKDVKIDFHIRSQGRNLVKSKQLWFTAPLDYSLFVFKNNQICNPIKLDISEYALNEDLIKLSISDPLAFFKEVNGNSLIYSLNSIRETSNHLVFKSNQKGVFIINKNDNVVYWDKHDNGQSMLSSKYYYPHEGDDEKIMFIIPAHEYVNNAETTLKNNIGAPGIKEEDNPILIFFKEKENVKNTSKN